MRKSNNTAHPDRIIDIIDIIDMHFGKKRQKYIWYIPTQPVYPYTPCQKCQKCRNSIIDMNLCQKLLKNDQKHNFSTFFNTNMLKNHDVNNSNKFQAFSLPICVVPRGVEHPKLNGDIHD